ncbi:MAG: calcium-binding protein, partial [Planctomycetaceae bacterium]
GDGTSSVYGGAGNDVITANSLTKSVTIFGEDGNDRISVGTGNDRISGGGGDDIITSLGGDDQIDAGEGDDRITITLQIDGSQLQVYGRGGSDSLDLTGPSNGQPLVMGAHTFTGSVLSLEFDNDIDVIRYTDTSASTILNTATQTSMNYGSIDFSVTGNRVTVDGASLRIPDGILRIQTQAIIGDFQSELAALSVSSTGTDAGNIVVRELNSLELI